MSSVEVKRKPARVVRSRPGTTKESPSTTRLAMPVAATRVNGPGGTQICSTAPSTMAPTTSMAVSWASRSAAVPPGRAVAADESTLLKMTSVPARRARLVPWRGTCNHSDSRSYAQL